MIKKMKKRLLFYKDMITINQIAHDFSRAVT